jgi:ABC-2 type transport system permease protein
MTAFRLELRRNRGLTIGLGLTLLLYGAVMGAMYPVMIENDDMIRQYMDAFPKEFLAAFGMTGLLSDPGVFFTTYIASWLWPIVAAAAALLVGTRAVATDLDRGFLDLPLATPVGRIRYLAASIGGQVVILAVLAAAAVGGVWAVGRLVGGEFDLVRFALAGVLAFLFACAIAGPTTLLSVLTLSRGRTSGIIGAILVAMYLVFVVEQLSPDLAWLGPLSAWDHFRTQPLIDDGTLPLLDVALFAVIAVAGWLGALWAFRRRDLAA